LIFHMHSPSLPCVLHVATAIISMISLAYYNWSLWLTKHHAMHIYWGSGGIAPRILTSALDGGEWLASRPGRFTPTEKASGAHWIGGWVGPRALLDTVVKRKIPSPRTGIES
jgi:hypothetical protein